MFSNQIQLNSMVRERRGGLKKALTVNVAMVEGEGEDEGSFDLDMLAAD